MNKLLAGSFIVMATVLSGCETMQPASYANYGDNTFVLRHFEGAKVREGSITDVSNLNNNDELKFAGLYSDDLSAVQLSATLQQASFSSMTGLIRGNWTFSLQLSNPANGRSLTANSNYDFDSGFGADIACMNTSNALTPAVQRLINKVVSDPTFPALIGR